MTTRTATATEHRITELEDELGAAQRMIDALLAERTRGVADACAERSALRASLEQIVEQRTRALAESEAQLREKSAELERQDKIKAKFISIAAHELRTPLFSIVGYLDLFSEGRFGALPPSIERPMSSVRRNTHRLRRLVEDMFDVSRIEAGRMTLRREPVDLAKIVNDVVIELEPFTRARKLQISTQLEPVAAIDADRDKLDQIVVNLVSNAIRYTPEQGEIAIYIDEAPGERYPGGWVRLRVRQNGVGIAEEDRARIFDPFLHSQSANHHTSVGLDSAALGLYIARGLIELHGGLITVDAQRDEFTEFTVLLPFKSQPRQDDGPPVSR